MYGHVEKLAEEIKKGASSIEGVEAKLWQVHVCLICYSHALQIFTASISNLDQSQSEGLILNEAELWLIPSVLNWFHSILFVLSVG